MKIFGLPTSSYRLDLLTLTWIQTSRQVDSCCRTLSTRCRLDSSSSSASLWMEIDRVVKANQFVKLLRVQFRMKRPDRVRIQLFVFILLSSYPIFPNNMSLFVFTPHHVFVDYQSLQTNGSPRMDSPCTNANFSPESVTITVCKASARIHKSTRRVHSTAKYQSSLLVFCHNGVGMM